LLWFVLQLTGSGAAVGLVILCFNLAGLDRANASKHALWRDCKIDQRRVGCRNNSPVVWG
jgi:hypothetical protein